MEPAGAGLHIRIRWSWTAWIWSRIPSTHPVHAYDLGAGVGRHTLPIVAGLPMGSRVTAVDLIPSALANLVENAAAAGLSNRIETVNADLESWAFPADDAGSSSPSVPWSMSAPSRRLAPYLSGAVPQPSLAEST